jgi:hypothetical protein
MLPPFRPTNRASNLIANEEKTAKAIKLLWKYSSNSDRGDAEFLGLLIRCSWVNSREGADEACRKLRNRHLAEWLDLDADAEDALLASELSRQTSMPLGSARWLVQSTFGFTHYYKAFRSYLDRQMIRREVPIANLFDHASRHSQDVSRKIRTTATLLVKLGTFKVSTGETSFINALSPALACLDPQRRFPVVNARTKRLLAAIGHKADLAGIMELSSLIGRGGLNSPFQLDVYSQVHGAQLKPIQHLKTPFAGNGKTIGLKSEEESIVIYGRRKVVIRKRHNTLINKLTAALKPRHVVDKRTYDTFVQDYRPRRHLLIEAKTETDGVLGRTQMRQAIGQLLDYRWREFNNIRDKVDLALLTPSKPPPDMLKLLNELGIEALWFTGARLVGTIVI